MSLFCDIDDLCQEFEPELRRRLLAEGAIERQKPSTMCLSQVMTIIVWFHHSGYRTFKDYYTTEVMKNLRSRLSQGGRLHPVCGPDAIGTASVGSLSAEEKRLLSWNLVH